ncbi:MAG: pyrimidine-nucleoside phosphorylase [Anaerovoracaceae bacterium]
MEKDREIAFSDIIIKKRDGKSLTKQEIGYFIKGYSEGNIPDYQVAALLMAIYFNGMNKDETYALTLAMRDSGTTIDLSSIHGIKVDKHSTGGVGDKTTLIVGPIAAACGVPIAKMSGRGLGFTGGTVDKMESIPGFKTTLEEGEFINLVNKNGISVIGQTGKIAPADKLIYALRDVTGTVENLSLITSSIMSKKLASGSDAIVLDVKCGDGAFMKTKEDAQKLGQLMVEIGNTDGKKTVAVITDMNQPLGRAIGNSVEVIEAIETLKGRGPEDITKLSNTLAGIMIYVGGKADSVEQGYEMAADSVKSGAALEKLKLFIQGQCGDTRIVNNASLFPEYTVEMEIVSKKTGFITEISGKIVGLASQRTGAGRATKADLIDLSAGVYLEKKVGDPVKKGEILAKVFGNDKDKVLAGARTLETAYKTGEKQLTKQELIKEIIGL